jgi:transposase
MAHAGGRPTKYAKKHCETVLSLMKKGESVTACCAEIGIAKDTFYNWVKEHPEFSDAYKLGMVYAERWWENIGKKGVLSLEFKSSDGTSGRVHPGMYAFFMKNRFHWTDRVEQTVTAEINAAVEDVSSLTPEERKQRIAELMEKANVQP